VDRLTAAEIRANVRLAEYFVEQGFTPPEVGEVDPLDDLITVSWAYIELYTCLDLDVLDAASAEGIVAKRTVLLRMMQAAVQESPDFVSSASDNLIQSFSVPGYSETKFDPLRGVAGSGLKQTGLVVNEWTPLNNALLFLMTPECLERWRSRLSTDDPTPASAITDVGWISFPFSELGIR
jgi:hypothetical protein